MMYSTLLFCRLLASLQSSVVRWSLLSSAGADVYSFLIDASTASSKAMTTTYLTVGEVREAAVPSLASILSECRTVLAHSRVASGGPVYFSLHVVRESVREWEHGPLAGSNRNIRSPYMQVDYLLQTIASKSTQLALSAVEPSPMCGNGVCETGERPGGNSTSSLRTGRRLLCMHLDSSAVYACCPMHDAWYQGLPLH